jgi:NDP-sugar pyrophosphorylase family protein
MILAAGMGTRLRPLTNDRPKALVEVAGRTLLEIVLTRLRSFGISEVIINTHYLAAMVADYLIAHQNFGMHIEISYEEVLLDTGGGLKHAQHFFAGSDEPFLVHNVDVLSTIDFARMVRFHKERDALATLAVQTRSTSRYLLFDQDLRLCGRRTGMTGEPELVRPVENFQALAFSGIHVLSPRIFSRMGEDGVFSIIPVYLRIAEKEPILGFAADGYYWRDLGRPEEITEAAGEIESGSANDGNLLIPNSRRSAENQ